MILIPIACFIFGGAVVYLYFAYKEREPKTDIKPPIVYLPPDIEGVKQQMENIFKTEMDYYKADITEAKNIIENLISSNDITSYQKAETNAKEWLRYVENRGCYD